MELILDLVYSQSMVAKEKYEINELRYAAYAVRAHFSLDSIRKQRNCECLYPYGKTDLKEYVGKKEI